ncbi:MAG: Nif3-like dinuclear metal center hexameric protein, partial [Acidimicrobiia bacterium]|nr:Nif3-like dinuclear metal center hexameric protein [Acidimicrobiia bacterium]
VHTAFDVAQNGAADALADALHLEQVSGFGPAWPSDQVKIVTYAPPADADALVSAMAERGAGRIGNYSACAFRTAGVGMFTPGDDAEPTVGSSGRPNVIDEHRIEMVASRSSADSIVGALVAAHPYEEAPFEVYPLEANAGFIGRSGVLGAPTTLRQFAGRVEATLGGVVRVAGELDDQVTTVACVPGSGGSLLQAVTADVVVTGDVSHHEAQAALERGVSIVDPGHAATERPGIARLYSAVSAMHDAVVDLTDDPNPWRQI